MTSSTSMGVILHVCISLALLACGANKAETNTLPEQAPKATKLKIEVVMNGAPNDMIKLLGVYGNQNFLIDSAKGDANGNYTFEADSAFPTGFYYAMIVSDNSFFQLLLDSDQEFKLETRKGDLVNSMKVEGCSDNELLYKNLKFEAEFNTRLQPISDELAKLQPNTPAHTNLKAEQDALVKERLDHVQWFSANHPHSYFTKFKTSGQNPELTYPKLANGELDQVAQIYQYRKSFFDNVDFDDPSTLRTPVFSNKLRKYIRELTPQQADSLILYADELIARTKPNKELFKFTVNWMALEYKTPKTMGTEALYVHLIDKYWTTETAFWSNAEEIKGLRGEISLMKPSLIGKTAQDVVVTDERGGPVSIYGMKSPVKVVFIYSYDCEHCQKEAPEMAKVYEQWKNKGLDVFALCTDKDKTKWLDFVKKNGMTFNNAFDPERKSSYDHKYHIDITPELYVLDRNNRIIASNLSPAQLPDFLETERVKNPW